MSRTININAVDRTSVVRLDSLVTVESANGGEVGVSGFDLDDEALGDVPAMKEVTVDESAASPTRSFTGFVAGRTLARGVLGKVANRRQWDVEIVDLNACLDDEVFVTSTANRPAETDYARMTWLLNTPAVLESLGVTAGVLPNTNTVMMDAFNYRGSTPRRVANDCAEAAAKNYFLYDFGAGKKLYYDKQSGTGLTSAASLSSVSTEVDNALTWAIEDPVLRKDPTRIYSTVMFQYDGGQVVVTNGTTESTYRRREIYVEDRSVTSADAATAKANTYLAAAASEEQTFTCGVTLPAAKLNDIRAGQRVGIKVPHLGISSNTYYRISRRTAVPAPGRGGASDVMYRLALEFQPDAKMTNFSGGGGSATGGTGGGGSSPWVLFLDEAGDSLTGWAVGAGTWSIVGGVIHVAADAVTNSLLVWEALEPIASVCFEAEVRFTDGGGDFGLLPAVYIYPPDPLAGIREGWAVYMTTSGGDILMTNDIMANPGTAGGTYIDDNSFIPDADTWYKIRVFRTGTFFSAYLDDVLLGSAVLGDSPFSPSGGGTSFVGLWARTIEAEFRNLKAWRLALP